jgi:hypothetical protein
MAMQPSPNCETTGPFFPKGIVFKIAEPPKQGEIVGITTQHFKTSRYQKKSCADGGVREAGQDRVAPAFQAGTRRAWVCEAEDWRSVASARIVFASVDGAAFVLHF